MTLPPPATIGRSNTNIFAIISLIASVVFSPAGIVLAVVALHEIRRTGQDGRPLALAGLWIGIAMTALTVLAYVALFVVVGWAFTLIPAIPALHVPQ
jgi:peptidyl-prolyl cis-trans isomerase B (cyclophilin B)